MEFKYDGGGLAKGGDVVLYYDGKKVGAGRVDATVPMAFSGDETCDIGHDTGTNVSPDYSTETSEFNGKIRLVQIDLGADSHEHLITPEDRHRVVMARQ
jgi:arylsulfatase